MLPTQRCSPVLKMRKLRHGSWVACPSSQLESDRAGLTGWSLLLTLALRGCRGQWWLCPHPQRELQKQGL